VTPRLVASLILAVSLGAIDGCGASDDRDADALDTAPDAALDVAPDLSDVALADSEAPADAADAPDVPTLPGPDDPPFTRWVDPFIGTGGHLANVGSSTPAATAPFGLVKVGPDTHPGTGDGSPPTYQHCAGYWYADKQIYGITHNHIHGSGGTEYGNLAVFPATRMTNAMIPKESHRLPFTHDDELATPGTYAVTLGRPGTSSFTPLARHEVTATTRCAHHRVRFLGPDATGTLVLDAAIGLGDNNHSNGGELTFDPVALTLEGRDHNVNHDYDVYFAGRLDRAPTSFGTWVDGAIEDGRAHVEATADPSTFGAYAAFDVSTDPVIELQLCLSYVSLDGARRALAAELPGFDFDGTAAGTREAWEHELSTIAIRGGSEAAKRNFYTALYHAMQEPATFSDVDGAYRGFDHQVHAADWTYYTNMSLWDTFRTEVPLITLLWPDRQRDMMRSIAAMKAQGGYVPKWVLALGDTGSMIGEHAASAAVDAYLKGVTDFDAEDLYQGLKQTADGPLPPGGYGGRDCMPQILELGWCPADEVGRSVALTVEYAFNDYCIGQMAAALGHADDAARYAARAGTWANHWDGSGFLAPRNRDGSFAPYDPDAWDLDNRYYVEGSARQWSWFVPHDEDGLRAKFGSDATFVEKLDEFFSEADQHFAFDIPSGWYYHGNEPDLHAAFLFIRAGRPDLTHKWARWALEKSYRNGYDGMIGNDDCGTLAAWYVFTAIGLYPWPCFPGYYLTAPAFDGATVRLAGGKVLEVTAQGAGQGKVQASAVTLDGAPIDGWWIAHDTLMKGGTLQFEMTGIP